ncbi:glycosyltransferase family 2 protein [Lacticaseibacillus porcinae]|uniref:glycosyltransferase family 2 protein n=1 Tax=Lacticaseibacillus porcinae TaxID=1123687 RepID=UPI000F768FB0|nr:glycosyltransferase [Lacticaseibacillus porcinae]
MTKLSIIVPVYNVERYLKSCIDSILKQDFTDFELLLIDDGSTDTSGNICDQYSEQDLRVKVVHQQNSGMSAARNVGLSMVEGQLIGFVDSDDYIAPDMYSFLINNLESHHADISICGMTEVRRGSHVDASVNSEAKVLTPEATLELILRAKAISVNVQNRIYRAKLFDDVTFPVGKIAEDAAVLLDNLHKAQTIVYDPANKYFYNRHSGSATTRPFSAIDMTSVEVWQANEKRIQHEYPRLTNLARMRVCSAYFYVLDKIVQSPDWQSIPSRYEVVKFIKHHIGFILREEEFTRSRKLSVIALLVSQRLYRYLVQMQKKNKYGLA